jgi:ABC-type glycerol-3-phosphate transport system substrate-binding protein
MMWTSLERGFVACFARGIACCWVAGTLVVAASVPARAETTVTFMGWVNMFDFQKPGWARIIEDFGKAHPNIKIDYIGTPAEDTLRQVTAAILAHRPPDIMQIQATWVQQLDDQDALEPLGPLLGKEEIGRLWKTGTDALTIDGRILGVPWLPSVTLWVYNPALLKRAGLDPDHPPTTWQDFMTAVDKVCALPPDASGKIFGAVLRSSRDVISMNSMAYFVWAFGGETVDAQGRQDWNNPGAVKALTWYRDTIKKGCSPDAADTQVARALFAQGRAAFELDGTPIRGLVQTMSNGKMMFGPDKQAWVVPPLKALDGRSRILGGANVLSISNQSKNKAAAATFIRFLLDDPDAVNYFYQTSQQVTTSNMDVIRNGPMFEDAYLKIGIDAWDNVNILPIRSPRIDAILDIVGLSVQKIINGADPATELKSMTAAMQAVDR